MFFKQSDRETIRAMVKRNEGRDDIYIDDLFELIDMFQFPNELPEGIVFSGVLDFFDQVIKLLTTGTWTVSPATWARMVKDALPDERVPVDKLLLKKYRDRYSEIYTGINSTLRAKYPDKTLEKAIMLYFLAIDKDCYTYSAPRDLLLLADASVSMYED